MIDQSYDVGFFNRFYAAVVVAHAPSETLCRRRLRIERRNRARGKLNIARELAEAMQRFGYSTTFRRQSR